MLEALNLECLRGARTLFSQLNFQLSGGRLLHVQGANGCGKTTLLRILCGLTPPSAGEILWKGESIHTWGSDFQRELCYLGHHNALKEGLSPLENVRIAAQLAQRPISDATARAALLHMGITDAEGQTCQALSQGQRRRVALSRLVFDTSPLWILDEPYVALDGTSLARTAALIAAQLNAGRQVVLTTHQAVALPGVAVNAALPLRLEEIETRENF
ncbi:MAG: cytochrome c biogenesis heme-transporting ATPase CcmA [Pseudomonadota bacterium]